MNATLSARTGPATSRMQPTVRCLAGLLLAQALAGCGGGGGASTVRTVPGPSLAARVLANPNQVAMTIGETVAMTPMVKVYNSTNAEVSFAVQEGTAGGTVSPAGTYIAPASFGTYHVVATSLADKAAQATITVVVGPVTVSILPTADTLGPGGVRPFKAVVSNAINQTVTWSVLEGATGGSMSGNRYTVPGNTGTFHVVATSVRDPTASATASVTTAPSGFRPIQEMLKPRSDHTATKLPNGKVLIAGGGEFKTVCGWDGESYCSLAEAELFDPATGTFSGTGTMLRPYGLPVATLLTNGKVLISGEGKDTELYDPVTGLFTAAGNMTSERFFHTATALPDGRVLLAGGIGCDSGKCIVLATAELHDPQTGTFTATGGTGMSVPRRSHTATRLPDGRVLITGGYSNGSNGGPTATAEIYDPVTATFTVIASMLTARTGHRATPLANGTVLITGGYGPSGYMASAELYDPASGRFSATGSMLTGRKSHVAIALPTGRVLVSGGYVSGGYNFTAEIYDPSTGRFTQTGSMAAALIDPAAVLLDNGQVLVMGGADFGSAELYR